MLYNSAVHDFGTNVRYNSGVKWCGTILRYNRRTTNAVRFKCPRRVLHALGVRLAVPRLRNGVVMNLIRKHSRMDIVMANSTI